MTRPHSPSPTKTASSTRSLRAASGTPLPLQNVQASDLARNRHRYDMLRKIEGLEISPPIRPSVSPSGTLINASRRITAIFWSHCCDAKFYRLCRFASENFIHLLERLATRLKRER